MNVFDLDRVLVSDYERFARSFTQIRAAVRERRSPQEAVAELFRSDANGTELEQFVDERVKASLRAERTMVRKLLRKRRGY